MRTALPAQPDTIRATSPLTELVRHLARLAAPHTYLMTARLVGDGDAGRIELRASRIAPAEFREYAWHVTLSSLERDGADVVAKAFARDARRALASASAPDELGLASESCR